MGIAATSARRGALLLCVVLSLFAVATGAQPDDPPLAVLKTGLGSGTVSGTGINCGTDCDEGFAGGAIVTLTATAPAGSTFAGWGGACSGTGTCTLTMSAPRAVTANFQLTTPITTISDFAPDGATGLQSYLTAHPEINTPARFIAALPAEFRQNWILMSRSESLQTGTAQTPRILMPNNDARFTFSIGMTPHSSYPGSHPNAIEYMQWDATQKNFRFHEIVVANIPAMPPPSTIPARTRGVSVDDAKCSRCHSTRNVQNRTTSNGTSGPPGNVKFKNKPNWDAYDSWGGMSPFNRDRIYQGSVEAAAFRSTFNLWNWRSTADSDSIRQILEQLQLQSSAPAGTPHTITRNLASTTDTGHIVFGFDGLPAIPTTTVSNGYNFGGPSAPASSVTQGGRYVTLRVANPIPPPNNDNYLNPGSDEGRGVQFFDLLGGLDGNLNPQRIADELIDHRFATGGGGIDVRPITLAIAMNCLSINSAGSGSITSTPALTVDFSFFDSRDGIAGINDLVNDTGTRARSLPRRKADVQKINLDRANDPYLINPENGQILQHGAGTSAGTSTATSRIRQDVFQRPIDLGVGDSTSMGGIYVDRELYSSNTNKMALFRYFLEPLGVSVDKWSMSVRGRSRTYTFADVFGSYLNVLEPEMRTSLGLGASTTCAAVIPLVNASLGSLPGAADVPRYTDVQRIFNKSCIECHGDLHYPPYQNFGTAFNLSEEENPPVGTSPMSRPYNLAQPRATSLMGPIYQFITRTDEICPPSATGMMPCGGPALTKADVETIRRWIVGGSNYTEGDPHIQTIDDVHYDFQSAGEFVLLRDLGVEIQTRQTPVRTGEPLPPNPHTGLSSCVSINTAAAVRVGPHRITYQPPREGQSGERGPELRIDGKLTTLGAGEIRLPSGGRVFRDAPGGNLQIDTPGGTVINITSNWWPYRQLWYMNVDVRQSRATEGVMGAIAADNWLPALPDGTQLGPRPADLHRRYVDLYEKFESAWRVTSGTSLFDYAPGTSTASFTMEKWPEENPTRCDGPLTAGMPEGPPPQRPLDEKAAAQVCGNIADRYRRINCALDVMATGENGFAKAYAETEQKERNQFPQPPKLASPADRADVRAAVPFSFSEAADRESKRVTYRQCIWPIERLFTLNDCDPKPMTAERSKTGLLTKKAQRTPSGGVLKPGRSYFWKVIAEDGNGGMTESETRRFVVK
jgi:mono/diheme cytochrome c family protein